TVTYTGNSCGASFAGGVVTWNVGILAAGTDATCDIDVLAPEAGGTFSNTATVTSAVGDPDAGDNSDSVTLGALSEADLRLEKGADVEQVLAGDPFRYVLRVENDGPTLAPNMVVTDALPAGVTYVSNTCGATEAGGVLTWNVA